MRKNLLRATVAIALLGGCEESKPAAGQAGSSRAPAASAPAPKPSAEPAAIATPVPVQEEAAPSKIAAQHLLVAYKGAAAAPKGITRTKEEARKRAEDAARRAKAGEDFSALVAEYSDDATKADRGNLGMFTRESKVKPFADAAFALRIDGVSDAVETKFGFHVIKRNQ